MKKFFLSALLILLLIPLATALTPPSGGVSYYNFSSVTDLWDSNDATNNGADNSFSFPSFAISGNSSPSSFDFVRSNTDYVSLPIGNRTSSFTYSVWAYADAWSSTSAENNFLEHLGSGTTGILLGFSTVQGQPQAVVHDGTDWQFLGTTVVSASDWHHYVLTYDGTTIRYYIDGVSVVNNTQNVKATLTDGFNIGRYHTNYFDGKIDEIKIYNNSLSNAEILNLYNYGNIEGARGASNFTITAVDYEGNTVNNFTASINGTTYNTTTGTITTNIYNNDSSLWSFWVDSYAYANISVSSYNVSFNYQATFYPENTINMTFYDELNNSLINYTNITIELISDTFSYNYTTSNGTLEATLLYPEDYYIRYTASGYSNGNYYFSLADETYNNLNLYMLPLSDANNLTVNIYDTLGNSIQAANVKLLKYSVLTNTFNLIGAAQTSFDGTVRLPVEKYDEYYKFIVEIDGSSVLETEPTYITTDSIDLYVNLLGTPFNNMFLLTGFYGEIDYLIASDTLKYVYNDASNLASQGCLYAYRTTFTSKTLVNSSCNSGAAGTIYLTVANNTGYVYDIEGHITKGGKEYFITNYLLSYKGYGSDDKEGLILAIVMMLVITFIGFWRLELFVIMAGVGVLIISISRLITLPLTIAIPIFVLSFVLAYVLMKNKS